MQGANVKERIRIRNILYATDLSRQSDLAMPFALSLARKYGSKVVMAHVLSLPPFSNSSPTLALQAIAAQAARESRQQMARLEPQWKEIAHEKLVRRGDVWKELSRIIEDRDIDLVVTGTHGRTGVSKILMGSIAEKIFRQAPCPVLTVGPNVCGEPEAIVDASGILCPIDFSPESLAAVPYAISLAKENGARLYLLNVTESPVDEATESSLKAKLLGLVPAETELACAPTAYVSFGPAVEKILEVIEELALDMAVLGVKKATGFSGASARLAKATAYAVVIHATCPVLTIREARTE